MLRDRQTSTPPAATMPIHPCWPDARGRHPGLTTAPSGFPRQHPEFKAPVHEGQGVVVVFLADGAVPAPPHRDPQVGRCSHVDLKDPPVTPRGDHGVARNHRQHPRRRGIAGLAPPVLRGVVVDDHQRCSCHHDDARDAGAVELAGFLKGARASTAPSRTGSTQPKTTRVVRPSGALQRHHASVVPYVHHRRQRLRSRRLPDRT